MNLRPDTAPFDAFDRFAHVVRDAGVPLDELVRRYSDVRRENLSRLRELVRDDADLERTGLHREFGEVTLRQLLAAWAVHDLDHVQQIYSAVAGSHAEGVGPWKALLGILLRREATAGAS